MKKSIVFLIVLCILFGCKKTVKKHYNTGELHYIYQTKNNVADGFYKEYYKSGKLKIEENFKNGKITGIKREYYENGNIKWEAKYVDGKKNGFQNAYFENGQLEYKSNYKDNMQNGRDTTYYNNGRIKSTCEFNNNEVIGEFKEYLINGNLKRYFVKENNKIVFYENYNEDGKLIDFFRHVFFTPLNDTSIYFGDKFFSKIKILGPVNDRKITIVYKILDENKKLILSDSKVLGKGKNEETLFLTPQKTFYINYEIYDGYKTVAITKTTMKKVSVIKLKK